jgi:hypothetical protein
MRVASLMICGMLLATSLNPVQATEGSVTMARVFMFNSMHSSDKLYDKVTLDIGDFTKDIKNIRYGKAKKGLFLPSGPRPMSLWNEQTDTTIFNSGFFVSPLDSNTDYIYVATVNEALVPSLISVYYNRSLIVPGMEFDCGLVIVNAMPGPDLKLILDPGADDLSFGYGEVAKGIYGAGSEFTIELRRADNDALVNSYFLSPKQLNTYFLVFGGTVAENDAFPPTLSVHKSKKPKN